MAGVQFPDTVIIPSRENRSEYLFGRIVLSATRDHLGSCIGSSTKRWEGSTIPLNYCYFCALAEVQNELQNSFAFLIQRSTPFSRQQMAF